MRIIILEIIRTQAKMVSDFRKKKILHVFNTLFDSNKSGTIDKNDLEVIASKIAKARGFQPGDAKFKEIQASLQTIWVLLQQRGDADNDGEISAKEWIEICDEYAKNPNAPQQWQNACMKFIFDIKDASKDGSIDAEEFSTIYASFGLNKVEAAQAFNKLSKGKSSVTWSEFQELWKEYFTSEDPKAAGNFIFGKTSF